MPAPGPETAQRIYLRGGHDGDPLSFSIRWFVPAGFDAGGPSEMQSIAIGKAELTSCLTLLGVWPCRHGRRRHRRDAGLRDAPLHGRERRGAHRPGGAAHARDRVLADGLRGCDAGRGLPAPAPLVVWTRTCPDERSRHTDHDAAHFSAAHRLHSAARDEEWNRRTFGKCNNPHGHGHTYGLEVTVEGLVIRRRAG